ncbi:hypothetical protein [Dactylosporangium sp. NPDC048998]|uniref:hypothetical protein n=1 Tax=Dactylosporangium sp. NPDC048998 TaxID=3363976 RepID=UPI003721DF84
MTDLLDALARLAMPLPASRVMAAGEGGHPAPVLRHSDTPPGADLSGNCVPRTMERPERIPGGSRLLRGCSLVGTPVRQVATRGGTNLARLMALTWPELEKR